MKRIFYIAGLASLASATLGAASLSAQQAPQAEQPKVVQPIAEAPKVIKIKPDKVKVVSPAEAMATAAANSTAPLPSTTAAAKSVPSPRAASIAVPPASTTAGQVLSGPVTSPVEPSPEQALTLEESIAIALQNHGDIGAARQNFAGSVEQIAAVRAGGLPQLGVESGYVNRSLNAVGSNNVGNNANSTTSLVLSQNIFDSGVRNAQSRVARAQAGGALAGIAQARSQVAFGVANTYFEQLRQERFLELAREQVKVARSNLELVQAQIEAKLAARVDQTPSEVELRQREFNVVTAENNVRTAQVNFRNALGLGRGPSLKIQDVSAELPPIAGVADYFAEAQRLNPDLKISQANLESAQASLNLAKIRARPQVSVDASLAVGILDSPNRLGGFSVGLNLPIFDGGARKASRRAAEDSLEATRLRDEQAAKNIAADIDAAYSSVQSANQRISAARSLEDVARVNLDAAQAKYREGLGIALEITTAQLQLFNAQLSTVQALYDYYLAQSALERATGRRSGLNDTAMTPVLTPVVAPGTIPGAAPGANPVPAPANP